MIKFIKFLLYKLGIIFTEFTISIIYAISYILFPVTKAIVTQIFNESNIQVNGSHRSDPKVLDNKFYCTLAKYSYTGLVDAYASGYYECNDLSELFTKIVRSKYYYVMCCHPSLRWRSFFTRHFYVQINPKTVGKAYDEGAWNVETSDEQCETLSTGYWKVAKTREEANMAVHDLVTSKLKLKSGMRVLDLGCGEGALCKYIAENYDVQVVGVNVSEGMIAKAQRMSEGLKVTFKLMDARQITGKYDRITCMAAIEHFGATELRQFFTTVHRCLVDDGIFLLEIYSFHLPFAPIYDGCTERLSNIFANNHHFLDVISAVDGLFVIEDCQNLRHHSGITLKNWVENVDSNSETLTAKNETKLIRATKAMYAQMSGHHFGGQLQVFQIVFSKNGIINGYDTTV